MSKDAPGMRGERSRTQSGPLRVKRGDTHIGTIEQKYDVDLGVNSNMHLNTYLSHVGKSSLNDLITGK